jgi:hypothetical protein
VHRIESEIAVLDAKRPPSLGEKERQRPMRLVADFERAWLHPAASAAIRKRILRAALMRSSRVSRTASSKWCCIGRAATTRR